jgi:hypothetical protein
MKPLMLVGLALVILGVLAFGYQGVVAITTRDTVAQAGPFSVEAERTHFFPLWPVASGVCLLAGVMLMALSASRKPVP